MPSIKGNISKSIVQRIESRDFTSMPEDTEITVDVVKTMFVSMTNATKVLKVSSTQYTRRLLKQGILAGIKIRIRGNRERWFLFEKVLREYSKYQSDKRILTRFIVKMPQQYESELATWLEDKNKFCTIYKQSLEKRKRLAEPRGFLDGIELEFIN